jgi:hypothetical protein
VVKKEKFERNVRSLFRIFRSPVHGRITFKNFKRMIAIGQKIHPLYLKFKYQFGTVLSQYVKTLTEMLQIMSVSRGDSIIRLQSFKKILECNDISLTKKEESILFEEGIIFYKH